MRQWFSLVKNNNRLLIVLDWRIIVSACQACDSACCLCPWFSSYFTHAYVVIGCLVGVCNANARVIASLIILSIVFSWLLDCVSVVKLSRPGATLRVSRVTRHAIRSVCGGIVWAVWTPTDTFRSDAERFITVWPFRDVSRSSAFRREWQRW